MIQRVEDGFGFAAARFARARKVGAMRHSG
jgi:hypothetical protein